MRASELQLKVINEIQRVPEEKLPELYDVIYFFRIGLEAARKTSNNIMPFAGCWEDMPDDELESFLTEIAEPRSNAFFGRTQRETCLS